MHSLVIVDSATGQIPSYTERHCALPFAQDERYFLYCVNTWLSPIQSDDRIVSDDTMAMMQMNQSGMMGTITLSLNNVGSSVVRKVDDPT